MIQVMLMSVFLWNSISQLLIQKVNVLESPGSQRGGEGEVLKEIKLLDPNQTYGIRT